MSALAIVKQAKKAGIRLGLNGDNITFKATEKPPPELLVRIKEHKLSIVAILKQEAGGQNHGNTSDPIKPPFDDGPTRQEKHLPKEPSKPSKPLPEAARPSAPKSKPLPPENAGPNYGASWGANLEADEAAKLAKVRAEIQAEIQRDQTAQKRKNETLDRILIRWTHIRHCENS